MRIYRLLLCLYPASFRADYGEEMAAVFRMQLRRARGVARLRLWFAVFHEVIMNAPAAHWDILKQDLRYTARTLNRAGGLRSRRSWSPPLASAPIPRRSRSLIS